MNINQPQHLFQLQTELIDMKVEMASSKATDRIINIITDLKNQMQNEMHEMRHDMSELRHEMKGEFFALGNRVVAIETRLGMTEEKKKRFYDRAVDYLFKAGYGVSTVLLAYLMLTLHLIH